MTAADDPPVRRVGDSPSSTTAKTIVMVLQGPIPRAAIPAVCERLSNLLAGSDADQVICDVGAVTDPDAVTVDALARLQLKAKRLGYRIWLRHASPRLRALLELTGLVEVVPVLEGSAVEPGRQPEQREHPLCVEEMVQPDDPPR